MPSSLGINKIYYTLSPMSKQLSAKRAFSKKRDIELLKERSLVGESEQPRRIESFRFYLGGNPIPAGQRIASGSTDSKSLARREISTYNPHRQDSTKGEESRMNSGGRKSHHKKEGTAMKKKYLLLLSLVLFFSSLIQSEAESLSRVFQLDNGILDRDGDSLAETMAFRILLPDRPTAQELALASDIAARANLESLVVDFNLVLRESKFREVENESMLIHIGSPSALMKFWSRLREDSLPRLESEQGLVMLISDSGKSHIFVTAGSQDALLKTGRAFFLRWPYLWDIWGREEGETYQRVEQELQHFLNDSESVYQQMGIVQLEYEFPKVISPYDAIKKLQFDSGEIKNLRVEIRFGSGEQMEKAAEAFGALLSGHKKGERTDVLNYAGCRQITFELLCENKREEAVIRRIGYPKRILTPSYKSPVRDSRANKDFDLLSVYSPQGFFQDRNSDRHADGVETLIVVHEDSCSSGIEKLASRLVLDTSGASFPLVHLDSEIENVKSLTAPIFIGSNNLFVKELVKTAKLKSPHLDRGQGYIAVVPKAFNASNALTVTGSDEEGLEKTLIYLSQTFPYLSEYRDGEPSLHDVLIGIEEFLAGKGGSAEAYLSLQLEKILDEISDKEFESFSAQVFLPARNSAFETQLKDKLKERIRSDKLDYESFTLKENKQIFEKKENLVWEKEEAIRLFEEKIEDMKKASRPLKISIGVSESPQIRSQMEEEIKEVLSSNGINGFRVEVHSSYKQGFFWIYERVIPQLKNQKIDRLSIRFSEESDDISQPKRFYSDPYRWLQELYPIDEIISQNLNIPLEKIEFEMKTYSSPLYEIIALDESGQVLFQDSFSPRVREDNYLHVLPEWGQVKLTSGWLTISDGRQNILDLLLQSDLERFWHFYQTDILPEVHSYILKKTGNDPSFDKQPYFQRLLVELWLSEPDFRLGVDEELISSLESIHDELYFDTLDFLRGITDIELEDESLAEDSSRYSAPGNILPLIHSSLEGQGGKVKVVFEDEQAQSPQMILKWKEKGKAEYTKKVVFPKIKSGKMRVPGILFDGEEDCIEQLAIQIEILNDSDYTSLIDIFARLRELLEKKQVPNPFQFPGLKSVDIILSTEDLTKEEILVLSSTQETLSSSPSKKSAEPISVPTDKIISPQECLEIVEKLGQRDNIKSYIAGTSYENRQIPVLEISTPNERYTSQARLVVFKPTLYLSGRQHANEVSATNYILKFAELIGTDEKYSESIQKINFVLHPMENPDGAELAYTLQEMTPDHSLHAGRYTSLGIDVGYQVSSSRPLLPEAKVRGTLFNKWIPDIYLNLHGYPSHEWVQQFSNYTPYLFRDYWIPRGLFVYYRSLDLPIYQPWKEAASDLKEMIVQEMTSEPDILSSNKKFYDRYFRWAARWQPHMNNLEMYDGLNIYAKRRSSRASRLNARRELTFVEETPELMDETARGPWLDFLVRQGLTYLWAHVKYLDRTEFTIVRIEEETQDRISIQFVRSRPGEKRKSGQR